MFIPTDEMITTWLKKKFTNSPNIRATIDKARSNDKTLTVKFSGLDHEKMDPLVNSINTHLEYIDLDDRIIDPNKNRVYSLPEYHAEFSVKDLIKILTIDGIIQGQTLLHHVERETNKPTPTKEPYYKPLHANVFAQGTLNINEENTQDNMEKIIRPK